MPSGRQLRRAEAVGREALHLRALLELLGAALRFWHGDILQYQWRHRILALARFLGIVNV